jgi:hypothetical protein
MAPVVVPIIMGTAVVGVRPIAVIGRPVITRAVTIIAIARSIIAVWTVRAGRGAGSENRFPVSFYSPKYSRMTLQSDSPQRGRLSNCRSSVSKRARTDGSSAITTD